MSPQGSVARGIRVNLIISIALNLLRAMVLAALARLLSPSDYGLVAAALVIANPIKQILLHGVEQSTVLQGDLRPGAMNTLFWIANGAAVASIAMIAMAAYLSPISTGFRDAIIALSLMLPGLSLGLVPRALLRRELEFGKLAVAETASMVVGFGAVSITLALAGYGWLSLVYGYVCQAWVRAMVSFLLRPGVVRAEPFDFPAVRPILSMAFRITKVSVLEIADTQIAPAFIGAWLGTARLGQFSQTGLMAEIPIQVIAQAMTQVMSTGFRIVRDDVAQLRETCRRLIGTGAAIALPLCAGTAAAAVPLVRVVLGPNWAEVGQLLPWLALSAACRVLAHFLAVMNEAASRLEEKLLIQLMASTLLVASMLFAVHLGLHECAEAYALCALAYLIGQTALAARTMRVGVIAMLGWIAPGTLCGALIYGYVTLIPTLLPRSSALLQLGPDLAGCAIVFVGLYAIFYPALWRAMLSLVFPVDGTTNAIEAARQRRAIPFD